jgi:hypothetical protein
MAAGHEEGWLMAETAEERRERYHERDLATYGAWGGVAGLLEMHAVGHIDAERVVEQLHALRAKRDARMAELEDPA